MAAKVFPRIADELRGRILSGELKPGARLPSQTELQETYKTTLMTARRVIEELVREGLVEVRDKVGVFVRDHHRYVLDVSSGGSPAGFVPHFPSLASKLLAQVATPERPLNQTIEIRRGPAPREVADRLSTPGGEMLIRHQVFYAGPDPISIANGYFPATLVAGSELEKNEPLDSIFAVLDGLHLAPYELVNHMLIRNASPHERAEMRWSPTMSVLVQIATTYTTAGTPVYCWESVLPGDRWILAERQYRTTPSVRAVG